MSVLMDKAITIVLTGSFLAFVEFLVKRHDEKNDKKDGLKATLTTISAELGILKADIDKKFKKSEKDGLRTQLLVMILLRPNERQEILTVAEHYFKVLHGDWYMTSIFNKWLTESDIAEPEWFNNQQ